MNKKFDIIILDVFLGHTTLPEHLMTAEFFTAVKSHLKERGIMLTNFITSTLYGDSFSRNLDTTLRSVFPFISRQIITDFNGLEDTYDISNVVYIYSHLEEEYKETRIYRDIKNPIFWDIPARLRHGKTNDTPKQ